MQNANNTQIRTLYVNPSFNQTTPRTSLKMFPGKSGNYFYCVSNKPFINKRHKPGQRSYSDYMIVIDNVSIMKITENTLNGSNVVWLERNGQIMFLIIRDKKLYKKFLNKFNHHDKTKKCDITYRNHQWKLC